MTHTLKEALILTGISVLVAVLVNLISPNGIDFFGQWDLVSDEGMVGQKGSHESLFAEITDVEDAKKLFDKGSVLFVDARSGEAYAEGHIKGAVSLPVGQLGEKLDAFRGTYGPSTPIVTYCSGRTCRDSHRLAKLLLMEGFLNLRIFIDGYPAWQQKGYPYE